MDEWEEKGMGTKEQKSHLVPPVLKGDKIAALGITGPSVGSDVSNIRTRAVVWGDHYVVNGSKMPGALYCSRGNK